MAGRRRKGGSDAPGGRPADETAEPGHAPVQLSLPFDVPPPRLAGRKRRSADTTTPSPPADGAPTLRVLDGGGSSAGHARGRLTLVGGHDVPLHLPDRAELDRVLLGALADLLAGRISPTAAAAIREAAVAALRAHDHVEADPDRFAELVRAARALRELVGSP